MKYFAFFIAFLSLKAFAVHPSFHQKINLHVKNKPTLEALKDVTEATDIKIFIDKDVELTDKVSLRIFETPLKDFLDKFAVSQSIAWETTEENHVRLIVKERKPSSEP